MLVSLPCWTLLLGIGTALAPSAAQALPVISEVFYDAVGSDDGRSFVELYGAPGTPLDGMRIEGVNGTGGAIGPVLSLSGAIPADGFFVVADDLAGGPTLVTNADLVLSFDFQNGDQTQADSGAYAVSDRRFGRVCASAQGRVCRLLCQLHAPCGLEKAFCRWGIRKGAVDGTESLQGPLLALRAWIRRPTLSPPVAGWVYRAVAVAGKRPSTSPSSSASVLPPIEARACGRATPLRETAQTPAPPRSHARGALQVVKVSVS